MKLILWLAGNAFALLVAIWLFDGITLTGSSLGDRAIQLIITGGIFGVITSFIKPILKFLTFPFIVLTLGLLLLVINALLLLLTSKIAETLDLGFHVNGFLTAVLGGIVIAIVGMVIDAVVPDHG
ncbi:MAG: phage holin family protein [Marmoricola sp.]